MLGGLYSAGSLLLGLAGLPGLLCDIAAGLALCAVVFAHRKMKPWGLLQVTAVQLLTSLLMGGGMTALFTWFNRLELPSELLGEDGPSVWLFALLAFLAGCFTLRGGRFFGRSANRQSLTVELTVFGRSVTLRGMVDSGNLLRDPISGRRVMVVERESLRGVLPAEFFTSAGQWIPDRETARKLRLIPTHTATGSGMLTAFLPEALYITDKSGRVASDLLVAPTDLSGRADGFDVLIPAD